MPTVQDGRQDSDISFGKYLISKGILTQDQVRESYQLLLGYRQKMPSVNLAQVVARHDMASKEALRLAYQEFVAGGSSDAGAPLDRGPPSAAGTGGFFPVPTPSAEPKPFGFQTVELAGGAKQPIPSTIDPESGVGTGRFGPGVPPTLDPEGPSSQVGSPTGSPLMPESGAGSAFGARPIPPTIDPEGATLGGGLGSAFGARGVPPTIDPEGGVFGAPSGSAFGGGPGGSAFGAAPLGSAFGAAPLGSAFGSGPGVGFNEGATILDRQGPNGTHAQRAGPGGTHAQRAGPGGTHRGPGGTHAGPGGTAPQASGGGLFGSRPGGPGSFGSAAGGPGSKGALLDLIPQRAEAVGTPIDGGVDDVDDDDDEKHEDTNIQSSTFAAGSRRKGRRSRAPIGRKKGPPMGLLAGIGGVVILVVGVGVFMLLGSRAREEAKQFFLVAAAERPAKEALDIGMDLDEDLRTSDDEVAGKIEELEGVVAAQERRAKAEELLSKLPEASDLEEKLEICSAAIEVDDTFARPYVERARVKFALAKRQALEKGSGNSQTITKGAMEDLRAAIAKDPQAAWSYYVRADILLETGRDLDSRSRAMKDLERVQSTEPNTALASLAKGRRSALSRKFDRAIELYDQAIDADPRLLDAYLARAEARLSQGNYAGGLRDANQATESDPNSSRALTLRAQARYHANNDRNGALADLKQALELDPANGAALGLRAYVSLERDSAGFIISKKEVVSASEKEARQALVLDSTLPLAHLALAEVLMSHKERSEAITSASRAVEYSYKYADAYLVRARLRILDGDYDHAFLDLEQVLQLQQDNARAMTIKASVLITRRDFEQARTLLDRALDIDRNLPQAFFSRGYLNLMSRPRNYHKAIEDFSEALGLKPTYADAYFYRAVCYHDKRRYEDAIQDLERAYELRQGELVGVPSRFPIQDLHLTRGHCYYKREEWKEARDDYAMYLKLASVGSQAIQKVRKRLKECEAKLSGE